MSRAARATESGRKLPGSQKQVVPWRIISANVPSELT